MKNQEIAKGILFSGILFFSVFSIFSIIQSSFLNDKSINIGKVFAIGSDEIRSESVNSISEIATTATQINIKPLDKATTASLAAQVRTETALREIYKDSFDKYSAAETAFNDMKSRQIRLNDQSLLLPLSLKAAALYQARDEMLITYLNFLEASVLFYAENGAEISIKGLNLEISDLFGESDFIGMNNNASQSASISSKKITDNPKKNTSASTTISITQKAQFLNEISALKADLQVHYNQAGNISNLESWETFKNEVRDPKDDLAHTIYPIFSFTTLSQLRQVNEKLNQVLNLVKPNIIESAQDEVIRVERVKIINQLVTAKNELNDEIFSLERGWSEISSQNAYLVFTQRVQAATTKMTQITQTLNNLYQ